MDKLPSVPYTPSPAAASSTSTSTPDPGRTPFKYKCMLRDDTRGTTFLARLDSGANIVVKYVERYGVEVHRTLADAGYAPKLLYFGSPYPDIAGYSYTGAHMVVMEYIEGETSPESLTEDECDALSDAVDVLHRAGYVNGDVRVLNLILPVDGGVKIIDFDWAGKDGEVVYPSDLTEGVVWHPEVDPKSQRTLIAIRKEHGRFMLRQLLSEV
ncbi:hypothetical protein EVG20_g8326 [Dentipellis fragilis]|uniref:Protein kinase domain-containing protein n=1 Tax=Dentipellis fragilis TaxID=205917 RepID=A0A4Y9Y7E9_9AGAM|nr:hypothetical protein EVG20_g8326 [Dentipellis fragilis]